MRCLFLLVCLLSSAVLADTQGQWQRFSRGELPEQPMPVAPVQTGQPAWYVCRANYNKGTHPGKINSAIGGCLITVAGDVNRSLHYEVLLSSPNYVWETYNNDSKLFERAIKGGAEDAIEDYSLYICRVLVQGIYQAGKIRSVARGCKIEHGGRERTERRFDLLVKKAPVPLKQDFSGRWQSQRGTQSLTLSLQQDGEQLNGTFVEPPLEGSLHGFLHESEAWGRWSDDSGRSGRFQWSLSVDGQSFQGFSDESQHNLPTQEHWQGIRLP